MIITVPDIFASRAHARRAFCALNNRGEGFDPTEMLDGVSPDLIDAPALHRDAAHTSDVAVYTAEDMDGLRFAIVVGTDASGSDDSRWAVRVGVTGVEID